MSKKGSFSASWVECVEIMWTLTVVYSPCRLSCKVAGSTLFAGIPIFHELGVHVFYACALQLILGFY